MKKEELIALCKKYNGRWIFNNEIDRKKIGISVTSENEIPELVKSGIPLLVSVTELDGLMGCISVYHYRIYPPLKWLNEDK